MHTQLVIYDIASYIEASDNIAFTGGGFTLALRQHSGGFARLGTIDAAEYGFKWGRLSLDAEVPPDSLVRVFACASDIDLPFSEFSDEFTFQGTGSDLLLNVSGRFLRLRFELLSGDNCPSVYALRLHMSGDHMTDYLPEIYRAVGGDFTRRFLSVFDSVIMDLEREIYHISAQYDYNRASGKALKRIADWTGVDIDANEAVTRGFIADALDDYETMYTVNGIKRSVRRLTGAEPLIIEYADIDPNSRSCPDSALYRALYGDNPYKFFILLDSDTFNDRSDRERFISKMETLIPAGTEFETVMLRHNIRLDSHCYLGYNSYISGYIPAALTGDINLTNYIVLAD
ncbi:MAG: hypothetical protein LBM98_08980 [Oscillospiraceae bacterium]|jgi:phage tail-like protein|nr:hypothetical protein [Oscillospiraceae bacterium]